MSPGRRPTDPARSPTPRRRAAGGAAAALFIAAVVTVAGGGDAFWVSLPAALALAAFNQGRVPSSLAAAAILAGALAACARTTPPPSWPLALLVSVASVAVLVAVRERLVGEREALRISASTDSLTGAANRRSLFERIDYEIIRHRRSRRSFTLLMLDLDGFKRLNDRFGHAAGDDLLCEVAAAIHSAVRDQDTVARMGGDEFCVLAPETDFVGARKLSARVMGAVGRVTAGIDSLGASPGLAVFPQDGVSATALLEAADEQLIGVKRRRQTGRARRAA